MNVTGKTMGEVMALPREEFYTTLAAIGAWKRRGGGGLNL